MTMTRRRLLDDAFKKSVVGNPAIATDSLARMYPGIVMQGWTTQDGTPTPEAPVPIVSAGTQNQETRKWEYEVEVGCGQLLNFQEKNVIQNGISYESKIDTITINGNKTNGDGGRLIYKTNYFALQPGTYTFSYEVVNDINSVISGLFLTKKGSNKIISRTFTLNESTEVCIGTNIYGARQANDVVVRCMLNPGTTALPYTTYRPPQTVTLTADRPLTKWDKLEKRNGQWGWVYKSNRIEMDGSETEFDERYLPILILGVVPTGVRTDRGPSVKPRYDIWSNYTDTLTWSNSSYNRCSINLNNSGFGTIGVNSADTFKQWLAQKYSEGNSFYYEYETAEETFVPLTTAEQEAMNALHTYRPTTVLTNQQGCQMTLTYKTRKSMEVTA